MMRNLMSALAIVLLLTAPLGAAKKAHTLESVQAEPNPERRARYALELARETVAPMIDSYFEGATEQAREQLALVLEATELARISLAATGKLPSKSPKHFKRAEIQTRALLDDLESAQREVGVDQRDDLDPVIKRISGINLELLMGIMTKKK